MKSGKYIIILSLVLLAKLGFAQNEQDVLRYAFTGLTGTARSMGSGNAFGALGADYSSIATNPAGLARYRNSELGISTNFTNTRSNAFYIDRTLSDSKFNMNINNIGLAVASPTYENEGWRYVNFGFGMNKIANYNRSVSMEGVNTNSSIVQHFEQTANGTDTGSLSPVSGAYLAWYNYLINNTSTSANQYYSDFTYDSSYIVKQHNSIEQDGGMTDYSLTLSGNYDDKLYIGGSVNLYSAKFEETNTFIEKVLNNSVDNYKELTYITTLKTKGYGVGAKLGMIFLPNSSFRFGAAFHTPARLFFEDNYNASLNSTDNYGIMKAKSPDGSYNYTIVIPGRMALSGAYIIGKQGFISMDYEYVDYRNGKLTSNADQASALDTFTIGVNSRVQNAYKGANTIRIGGEYIYDKVYALRLGGGINGSPYAKSTNAGSALKTAMPFITCGFGIRNGNYFLDFAVAKKFNTNYYAPYTLNPGGVAKYYTSEIKNSTTNVTASIGLKF